MESKKYLYERPLTFTDVKIVDFLNASAVNSCKGSWKMALHFSARALQLLPCIGGMECIIVDKSYSK